MERDKPNVRELVAQSLEDGESELVGEGVEPGDALVLEGGRVSDAVFDALRAALSDEEILELTYITALYEMHATMSRALRLEYDDVDERIVEIAAPTAEANQDVMRMVDEQER